jgi:predicted small secreted protein
MKKILLPMIALCALSLASCSTISRTATTVDVETQAVSRNNAELKVAQQKINYTLRPTGAVRKLGVKNVKSVAVAEALKEANNADVLVAPQYEIKYSTNIFGKTKVKYVTVTGYPATYVHFTPVQCPGGECGGRK